MHHRPIGRRHAQRYRAARRLITPTRHPPSPVPAWTSSTLAPSAWTGRQAPHPATATKVALRSLARRWQALQTEIDDLDSHLTNLVTAVAPDLVALPASVSTPPGNSSSPPTTTPTDCTPKRPSPASAASPPSPPAQDAPTATACTAVATATPTAPSGA